MQKLILGFSPPFSPRSTSLSLKTPFADAQTEKRGLQRRVSNRRKITEEAFGAAVNRKEMGGEYHYWNICESTFFVGFTIVSSNKAVDIAVYFET